MCVVLYVLCLYVCFDNVYEIRLFTASCTVVTICVCVLCVLHTQLTHTHHTYTPYTPYIHT